jgi:hypothetical protein
MREHETPLYKFFQEWAMARGERIDPMITVLNIKTDPLPDGWIYIGRAVAGHAGSPLQNPWRLHEFSDRELILAKYKRHLWEALKRPRGEDALAIRLEVFRLARLAKKGDLHLGCWCAPLPCHGDLVKAAVEWVIAEGISETDDLNLQFTPKPESERLV